MCKLTVSFVIQRKHRRGEKSGFQKMAHLTSTLVWIFLTASAMIMSINPETLSWNSSGRWETNSFSFKDWEKKVKSRVFQNDMKAYFTGSFLFFMLLQNSLCAIACRFCKQSATLGLDWSYIRIALQIAGSVWRSNGVHRVKLQAAVEGCWQHIRWVFRTFDQIFDKMTGCSLIIHVSLVYFCLYMWHVDPRGYVSVKLFTLTHFKECIFHDVHITYTLNLIQSGCHRNGPLEVNFIMYYNS